MTASDPATRLLVLTVPGLGRLAAAEIAALPGVHVTATGNDGRADVVVCEAAAGREAALLELRSVEDVLVEVGRTLRSEGDRPAWIAKRLWKPARVRRALALWRRVSGGRGAVTYRVVVRVLQERSFRRTELRRATSSVVAAAEPSWRRADPAGLELWVVEYARGKFLAGVRLTTSQMRQRGGRSQERSGALRPAVAGAMVGLAGVAGGDPGVLLDPCCGSGTLLAEGLTSGWSMIGRDIDPDAVRVARRNVRAAAVEVDDAAGLSLDDDSVDGCVSNLPFGRQYDVDGDPELWLRTVLGEMARVTRPGGSLVLLAPRLPRSVVPTGRRIAERHPLRLLGTKTTIWALR